MLLHKQDGVAALEAELATTDAHEPKRLFPGNFRRDANPARRVVLARLDVALKAYGTFRHSSSSLSGTRVSGEFGENFDRDCNPRRRKEKRSDD